MIQKTFPKEKDELIFIISLPGMTRKCALNLLSIFGSPSGVLEAMSKGSFQVELHRAWTRWSALARGYRRGHSLKTLASRRIGVVVSGEDSYPWLLKEIADPPLALFIKGNLPPPDSVFIAIVGSRNPTPYGVEVAKKLGRELSAAGVCVVSGAAAGIDSAAHRGALELNGFTIAVLGCGVDIAYPASNRLLLESIRKNGCLISEYPPGIKPDKFRFPERNRIIAGMCNGVVVVEAAEKSGALVTAECALSENREVFAVPGSIFSPKSAGTNFLIKNGATPVTCANDIFEGIGISKTAMVSRGSNERKKTLDLLSEMEAMIVNAINDGYVYPEEISNRCSIESRLALSLLSQLELKGIIAMGSGGVYFSRIQ